ncbi:MAG: hypothetical protein ACIALR_05465 [Blastopirellula sp. JB062]
MATLAPFVAGPYAATYDASGAVEGTPGQSAGARNFGIVDMFRISRTVEGEDIAGTNLYGKSVIDSIYSGGNMFLTVTLKSWPTHIKDVLWPFGTNFGDIGTIGRAMSDLAGAIVLTPTTGTPAAANDAKIRTFGKAIISPQHNLELINGPINRETPIVFRLYPYLNSTVPVWFVESDPAE